VVAFPAVPLPLLQLFEALGVVVVVRAEVLVESHHLGVPVVCPHGGEGQGAQKISNSAPIANVWTQAVKNNEHHLVSYTVAIMHA
jgi:hypothetical protein